MGDTQYPYPVALHWKDDPKILKNLKNKLLLYFQKERESNGGECEIWDTDCSRGHILIHFKEKKAQDGVLRKDTHEIKLPGGKKITLDVRSVGASGGPRPEEPAVDSRENLVPKPTEIIKRFSAHPQTLNMNAKLEETNIIWVAGLLPDTSEDYIILYSGSSRNGGWGSVKDTVAIPAEGAALVTFPTVEDIDKFSAHPRFQTLNMKVKLLEDTNTIRVEGLPPNTSEDNISKCFESQKHGGCGSVKDTVVIPAEGAALVTFPTVEATKNKVLIENIQDSCTSEMLSLLVENISEKREDKDFSVERILEKQSAVITFTCDIDTSRIIEKFSAHHRVQALKMNAKLLEETYTIRVEGLPPNTSEDYIILYFENPRNGSCGSVKDTVVIPAVGAALVTFPNVEAAKNVLEKKHHFVKKEVFVYPYYPSQDIVLYGKQRPRLQKPEPLSFPISPYILEFILSKVQMKDNMEKTMRSHTCEIKWPNPPCSNPVITLGLPDTVDLKTLAKVLPTWKDDVYTEFSRLISKYKVSEYKMDQSAWDVVKENAVSSTYNEVLIKPDHSSGKVFLTGLSKDVAKIDPTFRNLIEKTAKELTRKTETLSMSAALYQIMCNSGLQKNILDQVPELKIDYDATNKKIRLCGLKEEVLTAKCEFLNIKDQMKCKSLQMDPHRVQFLMSTNNEELSSLLFVRHNINAVLEIDDDAVQLAAYSKKDQAEAEEHINQELICRQIVVEERSVLRIPEWRLLNSELLKKFNAENITVLIQESYSGEESNVAVVGLSSNVEKCYQQINDFLEKNTTVKKIIKTKSLVVIQYLKEEKKQVLDDLKRLNISMTIGKKSIGLKGPRLYVTEAYSSLNDVIHCLYSDTLHIDKPGAKKYWLINKDIYVTTAKNKFKCLIRLQSEEEEEIEEDEMEETEIPKCQVSLPNGTVISVHKDDLCRLHVDVVVNAANENLKHIGGLAWALLKAAGPKLQADSDHIIKTEGSLSAGESVITDSGRLPCKQVIHAVGPRWNSVSPSQGERLLQKAVTSSLKLAEEYCHNSIAIPAISSGIFGCPVDKSAENIIKAIKEYMNGKPKGSSTIKEIYLVDSNKDTVRVFASTLKKVFSMGEETIPAPKHREKRQAMVEAAAPAMKVYKPSGSTNQMMTKENIVISVREGFIQDAVTEVVVNSVGKDLSLGSGGASKALVGRAGNKLQQCLRDAASGVQVADGSVFITEGCNLSCTTVIHVVVPAWDRGKGSSEKIFRQVVRNCLCESEKNQMRSITFPAIGTGILGFPKNAVASFMFEEILEFSRSNPQHVREVTFILHPSDKETLVEFSKELNSRMDRNAPTSTESPIMTLGTSYSSHTSAGSGPGFFGPVSTPVPGTHEMKVGMVTYQVKIGDITKEDTDIIVNSTDQSFRMKSGVSKAILEAAGQSVEDECAQLATKRKKKFIVTKSGNLLCKNILHMVGTNSTDAIKAFITEALTECAKRQATSVAFPAIGTGVGNVSPSDVAESILESVADFARAPQSVQTVKVVIFQQQMLKDFHTSMKKKEGTSVPTKEGLVAKVTKGVKSLLNFMGYNTEEKPKIIELRENIEPAIFQLCAESQGMVANAKSWLQDLIMKDQHENLINDDWIQDIDNKEQTTIMELQKKHEVSLIFDLPNSTVKVLGLSRDVLEVSNKIQEMIKVVRDKKTREREAELCSNLVEWGYNHGNNFNPFDKITNMELEKAKNEDRQSITIDLNGVKYLVTVELLTARDPTGNTIKLQRKSKHEKFDVPMHWAPMQNEHVKVVPVGAGSPEYTDVEAQFRRTCQMRIIKIERIQNCHLWIKYQIKKQSIDAKNGSTINEKQLFHGCDINAVTIINHNGFNRNSYAGKNAACFGNGTYFAVNANYSAQDTYSQPDGNGYKYMYLSRVITGEFCVGKTNMIAPPPKNPSNPTDLYDSATDNTSNPAMYVIFHEVQAYPEYLITFIK